MAGLKKLEARIAKIEGRNRKVEADKTWETSYTRRIALALFTYLAIGFYFEAIAIPNAWLNAIVPAVAFMLSTLTRPFLKSVWLEHLHKK